MLGKGEVESSILSCSTIFANKINRNGAAHSLFPGEQTAKVPQKFARFLGKIRGACSLFVRYPFRVAYLHRHPEPRAARFVLDAQALVLKKDQPRWYECMIALREPPSLVQAALQAALNAMASPFEARIPEL